MSGKGMGKRRVGKTVVSFLLTFAMLLTSSAVAQLGGITVSAEDSWTDTGLITNGDFETSDSTVWTTNMTSTESWSGGQVKDGLGEGYVHVMQFYNGVDSNTATLKQTVSDVEAGTYRLFFEEMGNASVSTSSFQISVKSNGVSKYTSDAISSTNSWGTWKDVASGEFVLDSKSNLEITITMQMTKEATMCFDNFVLQKKTTSSGGEAEFDGMLEDFETDNVLNDWIITEGNNVNRTIKKEPEWSTNNQTSYFHIDNQTGNEATFGMNRTISDVPAGTYSLSYILDSDSSFDDPGLAVQLRDGDRILVTSSFTQVNGYNTWKNVVTNPFTLDNTSNLTIVISGTMPKNYWAGLDEIKLVAVTPEEDDDISLSQLQALLESVPRNYETAGFTSSSLADLSAAIEAAKGCTAESDAATIESCYTALDTALKSLVYQDSKIYVKKVDGMRDDFIKGIDISSYISEVNSGVVYRNWDGQAVEGKEFIKLFAAEGVNYIRLRVWNDPKTTSGTYYGGGNNDLVRTVEICNIIRDYNTTYGDTYGEIKVLVDIQYSDFWADPDKQAAPKAWQGMNIDQKTAAVSEFTNTVLTQVAATRVEIGMVQIGNETNTGICGERIPEYSTEGSTNEAKAKLADTGYIKIFKAGCEAVDTYNRANSTNIKKVVHFTDPHNAGTYFAQMLLDGGVNYDVYATSYYPFWHGTTSNLNTMLKNISNLQNESGNNIEVMVAETQYVYTNEDYDGADNQAYEGKNNIDLSGWPVSVQGQANELRDVIAAVAGVGERGIGAFYWEPGWLGVGNAYDENGELSETALAANKNKWETYGSGWATDAAAEYDTSAAEWGGGGTNNENASLFDFTGHPQSSLHVFKYVNYGAVASQKSYYNYEYGADQGSITISAGLTASEIQKKLEDGIKGVYILYNDGSKGDKVVPIAWSASSLSELEKKIATNSAIGNAYLVKGTVTVDGEAHDVQATVNVEPAKNLLKNGNFESMDGWTAEPASIVFQDSDNPRNGADNNRKCIAFKTYGPNVTGLTADGNGCYLATVSQNVTITEPGVYEAKAFFEGASGTGERTGEKINVTVAYGDTTLTSNAVVLSGWMNWQCATVSEITVTQKMIDEGNNTLTVSANLLLCKDTWGSLDDFYLYKIADVTETPETPADSESPVTPTEPTKPTVPTTPTKPTTPVETEIPTKPTTPVVPPASGVTSVTASSQAGAPSVSIETDSSKLASMLCTEAEQKKIAEGTPLYVSMTVANITATVSQKEKELVTTAAKGYNIGEYLDITLFKQLGNDPKSKVTEVNGKLQVAVTVPTALLNTDASVNRTYKMVRIHNDEATLLDSNFNKATGVLTFETDRFSTYAIVYTDSDVPVTGDATPIAAWAWILVISAALLIAAFGIYRRRQRR
ncbi:MAG: glycosyl hydrolase 53 family protein [Lachnospiraceae bacterium]|nr:glycosyl hydrolase 53 family protein [Lachnospiraceae bacterium]